MSEQLLPTDGWHITNQVERRPGGAAILHFAIHLPPEGTAGADSLRDAADVVERGTRGSVLAHVQRCMRNRCFPVEPHAEALEHAEQLKDVLTGAEVAYRRRLAQAVGRLVSEIQDVAVAITLADRLEGDPAWAQTTAEMVTSVIDSDNQED